MSICVYKQTIITEENTAGAGSFGVGSGEQGFLTSSPATISTSGGATTGYLGYQPYVNGLRAYFFKIICPPDSPPQPKGCTDPEATNYDSNAQVDDGSCVYREEAGCTDPDAFNYNPEAIIDNGTCEYNEQFKKGCTDPNAENFEPQATTDDGSCYYSEDLGCTYPAANRYQTQRRISRW